MKLVQTSAVQTTQHKHPVFTDISKIPWTDWVIEGTYFKLLRVLEDSGGFTFLLKVDPQGKAPVHGHVGASEVYIIDGEFGYDDDRGGAGWYGYEPAGAQHQPDSPKGSLMFAVVYGPLVGYNEDGSVAAVIDGRAMYELAKANNAHTHLHVNFDE